MLKIYDQEELEKLKKKMELAGKKFITNYADLDILGLPSDYQEDINGAADSINKLFVINQMIFKDQAKIRVTKDGKQILSES